ncbi:hypothetical protein ANANG_G00175110, partial [Anguilla anguilla]
MDAFSQSMAERGKDQLTSSSQNIGKHLPADEQREFKNIDKKRIKEATAGKTIGKSVHEIEIQNKNSIAGVFLQSTKESMSICEAKSKGLLTPGTSLLLLEAQAATGFMIDPVKNKKLTVEDAVATGVVDVDLKRKLLSAERAVTGYN